MKMLPWLCIFFLTSCCCHTTRVVEVPLEGKDIQMLSQIQYLATQMKHQDRLTLERSWMSKRGGKERLYLRFSSQDILSLMESRTVLVDTVELFEKNLGMPYKDLDIEIHFESFYVKYVDPYANIRTRMRNGIVTYYASDAENCDIDCKHTRTESFTQTRTIVQAARRGDAHYKKKETRMKPSVFTFE